MRYRPTKNPLGLPNSSWLAWKRVNRLSRTNRSATDLGSVCSSFSAICFKMRTRSTGSTRPLSSTRLKNSSGVFGGAGIESTPRAGGWDDAIHVEVAKRRHGEERSGVSILGVDRHHKEFPRERVHPDGIVIDARGNRSQQLPDHAYRAVHASHWLPVFDPLEFH